MAARPSNWSRPSTACVGSVVSQARPKGEGGDPRRTAGGAQPLAVAARMSATIVMACCRDGPRNRSRGELESFNRSSSSFVPTKPLARRVGATERQDHEWSGVIAAATSVPSGHDREWRIRKTSGRASSPTRWRAWRRRHETARPSAGRAVTVGCALGESSPSPLGALPSSTRAVTVGCALGTRASAGNRQHCGSAHDTASGVAPEANAVLTRGSPSGRIGQSNTWCAPSRTLGGPRARPERVLTQFERQRLRLDNVTVLQPRPRVRMAPTRPAPIPASDRSSIGYGR
jgi:hypothetical protein